MKALSTLGQKLWDDAAQLLDKNIGSKGKRAMFLASLVARVCPPGKLDTSTLERLNTLFKLVNDEHALVVPYALSKVIWHGKSCTEIFTLDPTTGELTSESIESMARSAVREMPAWLHYGEPQDIEKDIGELLHNFKVVFS